MVLAVTLHNTSTLQLSWDVIWPRCKSAIEDIPISLVMSRLDTILNPQDNGTPVLRFDYVDYAEIFD